MGERGWSTVAMGDGCAVSTVAMGERRTDLRSLGERGRWEKSFVPRRFNQKPQGGGFNYLSTWGADRVVLGRIGVNLLWMIKIMMFCQPKREFHQPNKLDGRAFENDHRGPDSFHNK